MNEQTRATVLETLWDALGNTDIFQHRDERDAYRARLKDAIAEIEAARPAPASVPDEVREALDEVLCYWDDDYDKPLEEHVNQIRAWLDTLT